MNTKKWILIFFIPFIIGSIIIGSINYLIDPLWTFSHANQYNSKQNDFNERQQKTNYIYFNRLKNFDGILLGSSRTTFLNQNYFEDMNIYNYALNSMFPYEYEKYLDFAKEIKGKDFKYIIIGADFYGSNIPTKHQFKNPQFYINKTKSFFYRYKLLLSTDTLEQSKKNYKNSKQFTERYYDRYNVKYQHKISETQRKIRYDITIKKHLKTFTKKHYTYNKEYKKILMRIKKNHENTKIIVFTSPITANLLVSILKQDNRISDFKKWLSEIIEVFGEVHHFMSINHITTNLNNYPDDDHYYPYIGKIIAYKIKTKSYSQKDDFGCLLNQKNLDDYIEKLKKQIRNYHAI
jgi:hypothetical protein